MATEGHSKRRTPRRRNMQSFSGAVIDLTGDSPMNQSDSVEVARQTIRNPRCIFILDDTVDLSSPSKQESLEDCAEKKSSKKQSGKKKSSEAITCPVCFEGLEFCNPAPEKQVMSTQCGHMYCYSCIVAIVSERKECPLCRKRQTIQDIHPLYV